MLNGSSPQDFVIATGVSQSLEDFIQIVFEEYGLDWQEYVVSDPSKFRSGDPVRVYGDPRKANKLLGWEATIFWGGSGQKTSESRNGKKSIGKGL